MAEGLASLGPAHRLTVNLGPSQLTAGDNKKAAAAIASAKD